MSPVIIAIFAILCGVMFLLFVWSVARREPPSSLRRRFGPEYDEALRHYGDPRSANAALTVRSEQIMGAPLRLLRPEESEIFARRWHDIEAHFANEPDAAVCEAHALVHEVMRTRGYPAGPVETQADALSVDHPTVAEKYRTACAVTVSKGHSESEVEALRDAMADYHAVIEELLGWQGVK